MQGWQLKKSSCPETKWVAERKPQQRLQQLLPTVVLYKNVIKHNGEIWNIKGEWMFFLVENIDSDKIPWWTWSWQKKTSCVQFFVSKKQCCFFVLFFTPKTWRTAPCHHTQFLIYSINASNQIFKGNSDFLFNFWWSDH